MVISISTNYRSKALVFSSLFSKKIRWRVKFNVYNFFGGWKLNLVLDRLFNKFTTGWITYTGCCVNKYFAFLFVFFLFSSVFFIESQRRLTHIIIELADQSSPNTLVIFSPAICNMDNAMKLIKCIVNTKNVFPLYSLLKNIYHECSYVYTKLPCVSCA